MNRLTKTLYQNILYVVISLLWPFASLLMITARTSRVTKQLVLTFFTSYTGYNFVISTNSMDANYYRGEFLRMTNEFYDYNFFLSTLKSDFGFQIFDLGFHSIAFLSSRITSNPNIFFAILGLLFGYFYSKNITLVLSHIKFKLTLYPLLITLMVIVGFWQINGFRFWISCHIFFLALASYFLEKKTIPFHLLLMSVIFHFSFIVPVAVFFLYLLFGDRNKTYFYIFFISIFISITSITESSAKIIIQFAPQFLKSKIQAYTDINRLTAISEISSNQSFLFKIFQNSLSVFLWIIFLYIYYSHRKKLATKIQLYRFFSFSILLLGISNFLSIVPSMGRFVNLSYLFSISFLIITISHLKEKGLMRAYLFLSPLLMVFIYGTIKLGINKIGIMTIFGNPLMIYFKINNIPLSEWF